jgi:hypothetical protein
MAHAGVVTRPDAPILVTTAAMSPAEERRRRERRYLWTMAIRVLCFIGAIVFYLTHVTWAIPFAIVGSLVLPWVAVVAANAGPTRDPAGEPRLVQREQRALDNGQTR